MAKKKQAADAPQEQPPELAAEPLSRDRKVRRAWSSQARCSPALVEFTEEELDGFAALVNDDGSYVEGVKERFSQLYHQRRDRLRSEAAAVNPKKQAS